MSSGLSYIEEIVPIEKLKEDQEIKSLVAPNNSREDLEKSLREKSQIFPLIADRNYVLIDGYTRLDIMRKLEFKEVKILTYDFDSQQERDKAYELIWIFNGARRQLDKNEKVALFQKIADKIAKVRASKNKTEESKIESHATQFSETESKQIKENEEFVTLDDGTKIPASEYERILKELDKENKALSKSDKHKMAILRINAPWLLKYVIDQKHKVPLDQAFRIYTKAKELGILDKLKDLAPVLRDPLISTREGRKIILNDEYRDLLEKVLSKQDITERAISEVKQREALKRGGKVKKSSKPSAKEEEEGEETETIEDSESDEYPFVEEWQKVREEEREKEEEKENQLVPQSNIKEQPLPEPKQEVVENKKEIETKKQMDLLTELKTKGFAELPIEVALVKINGKCYVLNVDALHDLEQGIENWKELILFLSNNNVIMPGEVDGIYIIPWRLLGRCNEWK